MQNAELDESQTGIKIAGRNINNLRYADGTTLMAESKEPLDEGERWEWKSWYKTQFSSVHFSSVAQLCLTLCNLMDCSTPGLPVHHQLPEFSQTHVHWVGDATQPSPPLLSHSPPALNLSQKIQHSKN